MSREFLFDAEPMDLPGGAWSKTGRRKLQYDGRDVLGLSQGEFRSYLYPIYTPSGIPLTSESPADHPHHNSVWIGSDQVRCQVPAAAGETEDYTYNFYVNETFQGRSPGKILSTAVAGEPLGLEKFRLKQTLEWHGPPEWGAPQTRLIMRERRTVDFTPGQTHHVIDILSELEPANWDLELGPTRHAYFNVRVTDSMRVSSGGQFLDANGSTDANVISGSNTEWVDLSGSVGGGHHAGITVMSRPGPRQSWWFVSDWGVITVGHFRHEKTSISKGDSVRFDFRLVVHDGVAVSTEIARLYDDYVNGADQ